MSLSEGEVAFLMEIPPEERISAESVLEECRLYRIDHTTLADARMSLASKGLIEDDGSDVCLTHLGSLVQDRLYDAEADHETSHW